MQDNLNTHDTSAFYENLLTDEALALAEGFDFYFTQKFASWLNMIKIEFSALAHNVFIAVFQRSHNSSENSGLGGGALFQEDQN